MIPLCWQRMSVLYETAQGRCNVPAGLTLRMQSTMRGKMKHLIKKEYRFYSLLLIGITFVLVACSQNPEPVFNAETVPPKFESIAIANPHIALTFARFETNGTYKVIAVTSYKAGNVEGVDLSTFFKRHIDDPIQIFMEEGYEKLRDVVLEATSGMIVSIPADELMMPVNLRNHHVATALNFPLHADETSVKNTTFLFPKLVNPSDPYAPVQTGAALLDYEIELAWVPLENLTTRTVPDYMGLILCNDYTDRETLLHNIDVDNIGSGKGFTTGKSFPGYLPVGNLFVIPQDYRAFVNNLELKLYVNNRLRQQSRVREMIWKIDELLTQAWNRRNLTWAHRGRQVSLFGESDFVPDRILIMSGTPHGTIFRGINTKYKIQGLLAWLMGGWREPISDHVISAYINDVRPAGVYLQPGDQVTSHAEHLGVIQNEIIR